VFRLESSPGQRGAHRDGLAGAHLAGDKTDGPLLHAPRDARHGLLMAGVGMQHGGGEVLGKGHAAEAPM
jgi:hypothetical protein